MSPLQAIEHELQHLYSVLLEKNQKYGNSAFAPVRIFSQASPYEQLLVRIDDKISRLRTVGAGDTGEDTILDLAGYLIVLRAYKLWAANQPKPELPPQSGAYNNSALGLRTLPYIYVSPTV